MDAALYPDWQAPANVCAFTTLRHGAGLSAPPFDSFNLGARCGDDPQAVLANREELVRHFALPSAPRWLRQVHGTTVIGEPTDEEPEADASITVTPGVVLAILTADCLPIAFCADDGSEVGIAHAGWRGLSAGIVENTVAAMRSAPNQLLAWLGPAAGPDAYEVGDDVRTAFVEGDAAASGAFVPTRPGHWLCDLYALARRRLAAAGVHRVAGGGLSTLGDPDRFFSHRRDGITGRMATVIFLQESVDIA
jgi:YfiH family protein